MLRANAPTSARHGFTIVELLIVIVVIGILAAITIVAYNGVQAKANDAAVMSDLNGLAKKIEMYRATNGDYPNSNQLTQLDFKVASRNYATQPTTTFNLVYCFNQTTLASYAVTAQSKSGGLFYVSNTSAGVESLPSWGTDSGQSCRATGIADSNNWRGYAGEATPQWRDWVNLQ